jgi:hypothetical protein
MISRMIATAVIWIATISATITLLTSPTGAISHSEGAVAFGIVLVLASVAAISTVSVWFGAREPHSRPARNIPVAKAKRLQRDRIERLIDSLDDDDIYELQARLLAEREEETRQGGSNP